MILVIKTALQYLLFTAYSSLFDNLKQYRYFYHFFYFCCNLDTVLIKKRWKKKNHELFTALHYKPLYNIIRSEKWGKKYTSCGL